MTKASNSASLTHTKIIFRSALIAIQYYHQLCILRLTPTTPRLVCFKLNVCLMVEIFITHTKTITIFLILAFSQPLKQYYHLLIELRNANITTVTFVEEDNLNVGSIIIFSSK